MFGTDDPLTKDPSAGTVGLGWLSSETRSRVEWASTIKNAEYVLTIPKPFR
jgi:hypothetical protein